MTEQAVFTPVPWRWTVHPGETLRELLQERGVTQRDLAHLAGVTEKHVSEFIHGRTGIGIEFAVGVETALGISACVLLRMQADHDLYVYRTRKGPLSARGGRVPRPDQTPPGVTTLPHTRPPSASDPEDEP